MHQKSLAGRVTVAILITLLLVGGTIAVFGSLGATLFSGNPSASNRIEHHNWCIETAIYLQDYMDNSVSHHIGTPGVLNGVQDINVQNWNAEFRSKLNKAKVPCVGNQPDPNQAMHRLFLSLEEEHKAYVFWSSSTRMLRHNFVRDSQIALGETTLP